MRKKKISAILFTCTRFYINADNITVKRWVDNDDDNNGGGWSGVVFFCVFKMFLSTIYPIQAKTSLAKFSFFFLFVENAFWMTELDDDDEEEHFQKEKNWSVFFLQKKKKKISFCFGWKSIEITRKKIENKNLWRNEFFVFCFLFFCFFFQLKILLHYTHRENIYLFSFQSHFEMT